jgi:hypothetical protein
MRQGGAKPADISSALCWRSDVEGGRRRITMSRLGDARLNSMTQ